jgi:hypothetical protein
MGASHTGLAIIALLGLVACSGDGDGTGEGKDSNTVTDDTGGGGGGGNTWAVSGEGYAWFVDGTEGNSVLHLELAQTRAPKDGEAYYGWVSKGGQDPIPTGEIQVSGEELIFEGELGINAVAEGYDTFDAWATTNGGTAQEGTHLWTGQVDPVIYGVVQNLLVASPNTPDGLGSLRSLEAYIDQIRTEIQANASGTDIDALQILSEKVSNGINGAEEDENDNGQIDKFGFQFGILNTGGYIDLILSDINDASHEVDPTDPIKEFGNNAYDCTQLIEDKAKAAASDSGTASVTGAAESAVTQLLSADENLGYARDGQDGDDEGTDIDPLTEGTLSCSIFYISEMMRMRVLTP